jgi:hypothetical protein
MVHLKLCDLRANRRHKRGAGFLSTAAAALLLAGCAGDAVFPLASLPPAPPGPAPEYPGLVAPTFHEEDAPRILSTSEVKEMEAQLGKLPKDREAIVRRRILRPE